MSTENNTGVQTRAMAQRVDNKANLEQLQRAADPAMSPTVEVHRTKEDAIEESYDNTAPSTSIGMYQISATLE